MSVPLAQARAALERGDYGQVVRLLSPSEPGAKPSNDPDVLLVLATAWMGLGRNDEALLCCRRLRASNNASLRAQARELQRVLEAPALERPREWSLTLPDLGSAEATGRQLSSIKRARRPKPAPPPPPAVGPTKGPLGFALVVTVLVVLGLLLGGCGAVRSELQFTGAGKLQLHHHVLQQASHGPPLQQQLVKELQQQGFRSHRQGHELVLSTPVLPSRLALERLGSSIVLAADRAGVRLKAPNLSLRSRNWLVAVDEHFELSIDLRELGPWNPDLAILLSGLPSRALRSASPQPVAPEQEGSRLWPLQNGATNTLVLQLWRWNPLGLGAVVIAAALLLSLTLQHLRRVLGFGLPELPR